MFSYDVPLIPLLLLLSAAGASALLNVTFMERWDENTTFEYSMILNDEVDPFFSDRTWPKWFFPLTGNNFSMNFLVSDDENRDYVISTFVSDTSTLTSFTFSPPLVGKTQEDLPSEVAAKVNCAFESPVAISIQIALGEEAEIVLNTEWNVYCRLPPATSCDELDNCSGHGFCSHFDGFFCFCDTGYIGRRCDGRIELVDDVNASSGYQVCPGPVTLEFEYPSEVVPTEDDVILITKNYVCDTCGDPGVMKQLSVQSEDGEGLNIYNPLRMNNTFSIVLSSPGPVFFSAYPNDFFQIRFFEVLDYSNPVCGFNSSNPCANDSDCGVGGICSTPYFNTYFNSSFGDRFCQCPDGKFGAFCELGCASERVVNKFGAVIKDGSGDQALKAGAECRFRFVSTLQSPTVMFLFFPFFDIGPLSSITLRTASGAVVTTVEGSADPGVLTVPGGTAIIDLEVHESFIGTGFAVSFISGGCSAGNFVDGVGNGLEWIIANLDVLEDGHEIKCLPCTAGTYTTSETQFVCVNCTAGTYADGEGRSGCLPCGAGEYQPLPGMASCLPCAPGHVTAVPGLAECTACAPGLAAATPGLSECTECDTAGYAPEEGSSECNLCPLNTHTLFRGAVALSDCTCLEGFFHREGRTGEPCEECPPGGYCAGGTAVARAADGYWASPSDPFTFLICRSTSECVNGGCGAFHTGALCSECEVGYFMADGYECKKCTPAATAALPLFLIGVWIVLIAAYAIANGHEDNNMTNTLGLGTTIGLWLNYAQFSSLFGDFAVGWPPVLGSILNFFSFTNLNFGVLSPNCSIPMSYGSSLLLRNLLPIFYAAGIMATHLVYPLHKVFVRVIRPWVEARAPSLVAAIVNDTYMSEHVSFARTLKKMIIQGLVRPLVKHKPMEIYRSVNAYLMVIETAYIFIAGNIFELFDCYRQLDGRQTLLADPSIYCFEKEWTRLLPGVVVCMFLFIVCVPAFVTYGVINVHKSTHDSIQVPSNLWQMYSSILFRFKQKFRFWAMVVIVRKLLVSLAISSFSSYPVVQGTAAILVLFGAFWLQVSYRPFKNNWHNRLETLLLGLNILLLLEGILFFIDEWSATVEAIAVWTAVILTLFGHAYSFFVLVRSARLAVLEHDLEYRIKTETEKNDLFQKRHIQFHKATDSLLDTLEVNPVALKDYMAFASDDDIERLAVIAHSLNRLEMVQAQQISSRLSELGITERPESSPLVRLAALARTRSTLSGGTGTGAGGGGGGGAILGHGGLSSASKSSGGLGAGREGGGRLEPGASVAKVSAALGLANLQLPQRPLAPVSSQVPLELYPMGVVQSVGESPGEGKGRNPSGSRSGGGSSSSSSSVSVSSDEEVV